MRMVRAKKHLGQHFLRDEGIAKRIVSLLDSDCRSALEIGPGTGVLTKYLLEREALELHAVDLDTESIRYLQQHYPTLKERIYEADFLRMDLSMITPPFCIIGNFPYNISSQILFRVLDLRDQVTQVVGMFQKEVAVRVTSGPGNKDYGILSVLLQAYYDAEYCFTVDEHVFDPPPKVKSGVLVLKRNEVEKLPCDEALFKKVVKTAFNQRRKTLRNSLRGMLGEKEIPEEFEMERPEQLGVEAFIRLTQYIAQ
ncbi:MAG: 16S rRNA (adenine(1518)-N(6)/adenine(1519)-N(6))-dimethyltransferase RsmA [Flavobacteriales bacterium]|nr:16S rRNA (adenine(1518)-N(6)/adenine(1519)-N(6))-dimethyltransferase RsmA [Flavobacteriales bacterium]